MFCFSIDKNDLIAFFVQPYYGIMQIGAILRNQHCTTNRAVTIMKRAHC
jgi:hypothetical protein